MRLVVDKLDSTLARDREGNFWEAVTTSDGLKWFRAGADFVVPPHRLSSSERSELVDQLLGEYR